jgi:vomeronasal 2 receptor
MERNGISLTIEKMIPATWNLYFAKLWENMDETNIIIICGDTDSLEGVMRNIEQMLLTWIVWVMNIENHDIDRPDYFMLDLFHGSLIFRHNYRENFLLTKFIQTVIPNKNPEDVYLTKL